MRSINVPKELIRPPFNSRDLQLNGFSVVESCIHTANTKGSIHLQEHMLCFVKQGINIFSNGRSEYVVREGEMIFLPRATVFQYDKKGDPEKNNEYISLMFFLKDEFIHEFIKLADIRSANTEEIVGAMVKPVNERLRRFFESIEPYFDEKERIDKGLIKIKMLELLYDISGTDKHLLQQLLLMKQPVRADITEVMENNYSNPVSIPELAYLSGRSLASFKRDFQATYNTSPSDWIRIKRLEKAKEALENTAMSVADICYTVGFENTAHFSRIFREHFGFPPTSLRRQTVS